MFDLVLEERRERDRMIKESLVPPPTSEVAAALALLGLVVDDCGPVRRVVLPLGWRAEADPINHRRWFFLDGEDARRVACFWKWSHRDIGSGSIGLWTEEGGFARHWAGRDSEHYALTHKFRLTLTCRNCRAKFSLEVDEREAEERPGVVESFVSSHEARLRASHRCPSPTPGA